MQGDFRSENLHRPIINSRCTAPPKKKTKIKLGQHTHSSSSSTQHTCCATSYLLPSASRDLLTTTSVYLSYAGGCSRREIH